MTRVYASKIFTYTQDTFNAFISSLTNIIVAILMKLL